MERLSNKEKELVRIGAAIASNCIACIEYHIPAARKAGLSVNQIKTAINIARLVKRVPADMVLEKALALINNHETGTDSSITCDQSKLNQPDPIGCS